MGNNPFCGGDVPRYFLHVDELDTDLEGTELPDLAAARREVLIAAREILAAALISTRDDFPNRFLITDEGGRILETVYMREVLPKSLWGNGAWNDR
jgi:hypothetical protein